MKLIDKKEFNTLTAAEKRIAIAKDVIARIHAKNIKPKRNTGFWDNKNKDDSYSRKTGNDELSIEFPSLQDRINSVPCEVCAKGALVCTWIGNFNRVGWDVYLGVDEDDCPPELLKIFGRKRLDNIEAAFEGTAYGWHYDEDVANKYAGGFKRKDATLEKLMQNIIDNNGELVIPEKTISRRKQKQLTNQ